MRTPYQEVQPDYLHPRRIRDVLRAWNNFDWTWQGFGMVRIYLDQAKRYRLNIWDERSKVPRVSLIHDHPWSFTSTVYAGQIKNRRYVCEELRDSSRMPVTNTHWMKRIVTGEEGHDATTTRIPVILREIGREIYTPGASYSQQRDEVHETAAQIGTVTLNARSAPTQDYTARVFWHRNEPQWIDAKPRPAAEFEIKRAVASALEMWPT